jgi:hypothetical protein
MQEMWKFVEYVQGWTSWIVMQHLWMFFSGFCSMIGFGSIMVILDEFGGSQNRGKSPGWREFTTNSTGQTAGLPTKIWSMVCLDLYGSYLE